jgi:predicted DCC family thiol-disulfide oxidoreductase YuxK
MKRVDTLPIELQELVKNRDVIVFDGVCVLCSQFFNFMLRFDRTHRFFYATAQSEVGQRLYAALGLPTDEFETNLVIVDGQIHEKLDAFAAAMKAIGLPWLCLSVIRFVPQTIKNPIYFSIARNRYKLFGQSETCMIPSADIRSRFIDGGFN